MMFMLMIAFTLLGSICSVGFAVLLLLFKGKRMLFITGSLIPYAIGTLLSASFFGMIPHAQQQLASERVLPIVLAGLILFLCSKNLLSGGTVTKNPARFTRGRGQ
jgi:zinc and cadmium transporter